MVLPGLGLKLSAANLPKYQLLFCWDNAVRHATRKKHIVKIFLKQTVFSVMIIANFLLFSGINSMGKLLDNKKPEFYDFE